MVVSDFGYRLRYGSAMTDMTAALAAPRLASPRLAAPKHALAAATLVVALFLATYAVNLQAPLYRFYADASGVGAGAVTVAFACYVAGLMPTLVLLGGLSDRIGRRIPIATGIICGAVAAGLLAVWPTWGMLCLARVILGVGIGFVTTAGTAYMTELLGESEARSAALLVTSATSVGFGSGALATGVSIGLQGTTPFPWSFAALIVIAPFIALAVLALPRADTPRPVSLIRLPRFLPGTWTSGVAILLAWSATGMVIALMPLELAALGWPGWTGLVLFLNNFVGFLCQPLARRLSNRKALQLGCILVPLGFGVMTAGVASRNLALIVIGAATTSAASYGFTYLGGLAEVSTQAGEDRARAAAGYFVYAYIGFSLPVIASGALADRVGLTGALMWFGVALAVANALLLVAVRRVRT
jgi:MFS family permease